MVSAVSYAADGPKIKTDNESAVEVVLELDTPMDFDATVFSFEYGMHSVFVFEIESFAIPVISWDWVSRFREVLRNYDSRHS